MRDSFLSRSSGYRVCLFTLFSTEFAALGNPWKSRSRAKWPRRFYRGKSKGIRRYHHGTRAFDGSVRRGNTANTSAGFYRGKRIAHCGDIYLQVHRLTEAIVAHSLQGSARFVDRPVPMTLASMLSAAFCWRFTAVNGFRIGDGHRISSRKVLPGTSSETCPWHDRLMARKNQCGGRFLLPR